MAQKTAVYTHGYHESVLRSHSWRTVENSAAYLLPYIKPDMRILDVGCGPGTITADFAALVPQGHVTGLEPVPDVLGQARDHAAQRGLTNLDFVVGDVHKLAFPDASFDIVHAHQVLQHVGDPVQALREMRRVTKPGGIVAARDADYKGFVWYPEVDGLEHWGDLYQKIARHNGGEPNAGRYLHAWARQAGFERSQITSGAGSWCFSTPEEIRWWSGLWADRTVSSSFATTAIAGGITTKEDLERTSQVWRDWGAHEDAWFALLNPHIICHV